MLVITGIVLESSFGLPHSRGPTMDEREAPISPVPINV
jgi:hypothetical protein